MTLVNHTGKKEQCIIFRSGICGAHEEIISVDEIVGYFKKSNDLRGKPKLFFIQACRVNVTEDDSTQIVHERPLRLPPESSDILVAHSTIEGKAAYRDIYEGSWFIQTLIKRFNAHANRRHLMDIMIAVNKDVANIEQESCRQMSQQVSTITKFVYFNMATVEARNAVLASSMPEDNDGESECIYELFKSK